MFTHCLGTFRRILVAKHGSGPRCGMRDVGRASLTKSCFVVNLINVKEGTVSD